MKKQAMTIMPIKTEETKREDEIKHAAEILIKAKEIMADKDLMAHVDLELEKKGKVITSLRELRDKANGKPDDVIEGEPDEAEIAEESDFPDEKDPLIERKDEKGTVLAETDESGIEIQGPAVKTIYTKPK